MKEFNQIVNEVKEKVTTKQFVGIVAAIAAVLVGVYLYLKPDMDISTEEVEEKKEE